MYTCIYITHSTTDAYVYVHMHMYCNTHAHVLQHTSVFTATLVQCQDVFCGICIEVFPAYTQQHTRICVYATSVLHKHRVYCISIEGIVAYTHIRVCVYATIHSFCGICIEGIVAYTHIRVCCMVCCSMCSVLQYMCCSMCILTGVGS